LIMMNSILIIAGTVVPVLITVVITSARLEHRITKVETDVSWLKCFVTNNGCDKKSKTESEVLK